MTETANEVTVTLEGFTDWCSESEAYIVMVKPIYQDIPLDATSIEHVVEEYCIDVSLGGEPKSEEIDKAELRRVRNAFYKVRKKNTANRSYWKRVVKIYPGDEEKVFDILESVGD